MTEVGTQNREWITYMLLSCAVFGANIIAKKTPSFVGVGSFDTFLKQTTNNMLQYLEYTGTSQVQAEALQSIAEDEAKTKAIKRDVSGEARDARGRWTVTGTSEFKAWFKDSKVVDDHGKPLVVYHGSFTGGIEAFDPQATSRWGNNALHGHTGAVWFLSSPEASAHFVEDTRGAIYPVYLSLQNPLIVDASKEAQSDLFFKIKGEKVYDITYIKTDALRRAKQGGHDGIIFTHAYDGAPAAHGKVYVVFKPEQIKSATGNVGAFDPKDPRITKFDTGQPRAPKGSSIGGQWVGKVGIHDDGTVTLLHGTSDLNARAILREGFKAGQPQAVARAIEQEYHLPENSVLHNEAFSFARHRRDLDNAWFTTNEWTSDQYTVPEVLQDALTAAWIVQHPQDEDALEKVVGPSRREWVKREAARLTQPRTLAITVPWDVVGKHAFGRVLTLEEFKKAGLTSEDLYNVSLPVTALKNIKASVYKFDPSEPRDEKGRWSIEGGGPERAKWAKLNQAAIDAGDAEWEARDTHVKIATALEQKYPGVRYTDYENVDFEKYHTSQLKALQAARALEKAEKAVKIQEVPMQEEVVRNLASGVANQLHANPSIIDVVHKDPREFAVGDKTFTEGGHFTPSTGRIELNAQVISYGDAPGVKGIAAHELSHAMYDALRKAHDAEFSRYLEKATTPDGQHHSAWYHERFEKIPGTNWSDLKPQYRQEFEQDYPATAVLSKLSEGKFFTGIAQSMVDENGHSAYAKSYWTPEARAARGHTYDSAINETVAEVTRYLTYPKSWSEKTTPSPTSPWVDFTKALHAWYAERQDKAKAQRQVDLDSWNAILRRMEANP
jgi:hypothetical protein